MLQGEKPEETPVCLNPMDEYFNDGYHSETTVSGYKYDQFNARGTLVTGLRPMLVGSLISLFVQSQH